MTHRVEIRSQVHVYYRGQYVHVCKKATLHVAYKVAKRNNGAPCEEDFYSCSSCPCHRAIATTPPNALHSSPTTAAFPEIQSGRLPHTLF